MDRNDVLSELHEAAEKQCMAHLDAEMLELLKASDIPDGVSVRIDALTDSCLDTRIFVMDGRLQVAVDYDFVRQWWHPALNVNYYADLLLRAAELRAARFGDVRIQHFIDNEEQISLYLAVISPNRSIRRALSHARKLCGEFEDVANRALLDVERYAAEAARKVSGWDTEIAAQLIDLVKSAQSADQKGRALEELVSELLSSVPGFVVTSRTRTSTEEIDLVVSNRSTDKHLAAEGPFVLVECKNWTGKCGKNEYVLLRNKLENRKGRCKLGFLVSWNGFTATFGKEMLRDSKETTCVVPLSATDLERAVALGDVSTVLMEAWQKAVFN
jgi:Holliday junction resolvase-like predicted endonuclease